MTEVKTIFLSAGEASGDLLGASLMRALRVMKPDLRFIGIGGPRMRAEGLKLFFPQEELAHMGAFELITHLPHILSRLQETVASIKSLHPDVVITIDSPDFNFRVVERLSSLSVPIIHYVAPSVWAWRPSRAKSMAQVYDHVLALLPFEPPYFTKEGLPCTFVGHPVIEGGALQAHGERFLTKYKLSRERTLLTVLPGSRISEINRLMPIFSRTVDRLRGLYPHLSVVIPTLPPLKDLLKSHTKSWVVPCLLVDTDEDKYDAFAASHAALACSGTVAVELALTETPHIIAYKISWLSGKIARLVLHLRHVCLTNILLKKDIIPEFLQEACHPDLLVPALHELLSDSAKRTEQKKFLSKVKQELGYQQFSPSARAAQVVLDTIQQASRIQSPDNSQNI